MPRGPEGDERPADVIGAAVMVARSPCISVNNRAKTGRSLNYHVFPMV